ncbi:MAG TPA: methyltransferase [Thermodesulfobacteriota bacterium]|nr:methyltransferase [Thermodesulfobacteriota bacterium]
MARRPRVGDVFLFAFTLVELPLLFILTPTFMIADWVYLSEHLLILGIALSRISPAAQDLTVPSSTAVVIAYTYPYAQVICLRWLPGYPALPGIGLWLVTLGACLSLASLLSLGRCFGIWPALRGLTTRGPYRLIRHPMYLSYMISDLGYNLNEYNLGTLLLVIIGWGSLFYRILAEERILAPNTAWSHYVALVPYRLIPFLW